MKKVNQNEKDKTAIKLANKYAESYEIVEKENKILKNEIEDLKANVLINKKIITDLFNNSLTPNQKTKSIIDGLQKEITLLNNTIKFYVKENNELKRVAPSYDSNMLDNHISKYQKQLENLSIKTFVLENKIIKKDNMIKQLNKKLEDNIFYRELEGQTISKEVYVSFLILIYKYQFLVNRPSNNSKFNT